MEFCDEADAKTVSEGLMLHARDIFNYANAFCVPSSANLAVAESHRAKFRRIVLRMTREMRSLLLLARYRGVSRFCNLELIEAYMEGADLILENQEAASLSGMSVLN